MNETSALLVYTTYRLVSDDVEAFRTLALRMTSTANSRDGCVFLDVAQDISDLTSINEADPSFAARELG